MKRILLSILMAFACQAAAFTQEPAETKNPVVTDKSSDTSTTTDKGNATDAKKIDPSGVWKWQRDGNNGTVHLSVKLKMEEDKLTGTFQSKWPEGTAFPGANDPVPIEEGKIDGDKVSFQVTRKFNENEFVVKFNGKIEGDSITGKQEMNFGNGGQEFDWNPKRSLALDSFVGKWKISFEGPNGDQIESKFDLTVEDDKAKGVYHSGFFGEAELKEVELKDDKLHFKVVFKSEQGEFPISYTASLKEDKLTGTITTSLGDQENSTEFTGSREPEEQVSK